MSAFCLTAVAGADVAAAKCVPVYDSTQYTNKPADLAGSGFKPLMTVNPFAWWDKGESRESVTRGDGPEQFAASSKYSNAAMLVLDIESWPIVGDSVKVAQTVDDLNKLADKLKAGGITVPIGYYSILPARDYYRAIGLAGEAKRSEWKAENDKLKSIAYHVDALFPSLYTFDANQSGWQRYAVANLAEARRVSAGKPVYAYLWMVYHESNKTLRGKVVDSDFWKLQLETIADNADGIVIWNGSRNEWNADAPWWKVTEQFIADHRCVEETETEFSGKAILRSHRPDNSVRPGGRNLFRPGGNPPAPIRQ